MASEQHWNRFHLQDNQVFADNLFSGMMMISQQLIVHDKQQASNPQKNLLLL